MKSIVLLVGFLLMGLAGPENARAGSCNFLVSPNDCYPSFAEAYDAAAAHNDDTIFAQAQVTSEAVDCNWPISISLVGGYDETYANLIGETSFSSVTVTSGSLVVENLVIN